MKVIFPNSGQGFKILAIGKSLPFALHEMQMSPLLSDTQLQFTQIKAALSGIMFGVVIFLSPTLRYWLAHLPDAPMLAWLHRSTFPTKA